MVHNLFRLAQLAFPVSDHTDRVTSTYAQGARPKETTYHASSFSTSTARESSLNRHASSFASQQTSSRLNDYSGRNASRFTNTSSSLRPAQEHARHPESSGGFSSYSSHNPWQSTTTSRAEPVLSRPSAEIVEPEGRSSTRRLLSRLFSRRSSQDSSSGSSSVRSLEDDSPSTSGESVDSDEGGGTSGVDPDIGGAGTASDSLRNHRTDLSPIQESNMGHRGVARPRMASWREPPVTNNNGGGGRSLSWLSSSFRGRCPPLLSRLRRYAREDGPHSASEQGYSHPQRLLRRWDDLEHKESQDEEEDEEEDDDDDDEEDEEEGAFALDALADSFADRIEDETLPELEHVFSPRRRLGVLESISASMGRVERQPEGQKEKTLSSRDQEKLRRIKEK